MTTTFSVLFADRKTVRSRSLNAVVEAVKRSREVSSFVVGVDGEHLASTIRDLNVPSAVVSDPHTFDGAALISRMQPQTPDFVVHIDGSDANVSADEIDELVRVLKSSARWEMAALAMPISDVHALADPDVIKAVRAADGAALYFSRAPIPRYADGSPDDILSRNNGEGLPLLSPWAELLPVAAYRYEFLNALSEMRPSQLEVFEGIPALRALDAGGAVKVVTTRRHDQGT